MTKQRITVKDIAKECGVSVATVSRVINRNGRFSEETEQRVREVMARHNYQPNQMAKGLRANRTDAIGVIVPDISNEFFSNIILTMQSWFFERGYATIIYNTNNDLAMERQCHTMLAAQGVAGVVSANSLEDVRDALERPIPTVYVDRFVNAHDGKKKVASISSDNVRSGRLAAYELVDSGCKRPAVITASASSPVTDMRTEGFVLGLAERGIELPEENIFTPTETSFEQGKSIMGHMVATGLSFDGVFCQTDWLAMGALEALRELHVRVPQEVAVVGHDDIMIARFGRPPLTTIHQDTTRIGRKAAELILSMVEGNPPKEQSISIPVGLVRRESTHRIDDTSN